MDKKPQEIKAKFDNTLLSHFFLSYIPRAGIVDIQARLDCGASAVVGFFSGDDLLFCVVFDFESDCLHVREVGGFFGRLHDILDVFAQGLAKFLNKKYISFNTQKRAVAKWAAGNDYVFTPTQEAPNEYRKVLH